MKISIACMEVGKKNILVLLCMLLWGSLLAKASGQGGNVLFSDGHTAYRIVVSPNASPSEKHAAEELQHYLREVSGASFPLVHSRGVKNIMVGFSADRTGTMVAHQPADDDEAFVYHTVGHDVVIYGGRNRGTMYGVYAFLENELGVRWYARDCVKVPTMNTKRLADIHPHAESPAFKYRCLLAYPVNISHELMAHFRLNETWFSKSAERPEYGRVERYWGAHTMGSHFVSAKEYFKTHPEYFALWEGRRISDGQLCLSNANVLNICVRKMKEVMRKNPGCIAYELSQNDNQRYCTCRKCVRLERRYGGHSGVMIWFVNKVASAVKAEFPDKYVGTMAYQYTLLPPMGIKPADNVMIRLSSSPGCFAHPLSSGCSDDVVHSDQVIKALNGWTKICKHLYVWDYAVNFSQYTAPYPNFKALAENIRLFYKLHVTGLMEQGQRSSDGGEFGELKAWVLAKLMWNPTQDADSLAEVFITDYYGAAAPMVSKYFKQVQALEKDYRHMRIVFTDFSGLYDKQFVDEGKQLLDLAEKAVEGDSVLMKRVQLVKLQILTAEVLTDPRSAYANGTWKEYQSLSRRYRVRPSEQNDLEGYLRGKSSQMSKQASMEKMQMIPVSVALMAFVGCLFLCRNKKRKEYA